MKLLIIESPGKQATIKKYLGPDWSVLASLGHLRGLAHNLDFLKKDFEPAYEWISEKANAMKQLKEAAKKAEEVYLAADKDMEGEQIAYSVCLLLKLNPKTAKRITFTEITQKAILYAIEHPGIIDMHRVHTQQCRALSDLLIGFTMSPLLWNYVAPSLSAGRCQTPAIRLVVEREKEIQSFQVSSGWKIRGEWVGTVGTVGTAGTVIKGSMVDELEDEASVQNYLENIHTQEEAIITRRTIKPYTESAPLPLITSTLQQQASALYHLNPKATMKIAQRLYEAGYITYMRTDKAVLSDDAVKEAKEWVQHHYGEDYVQQERQQERQEEEKEEKEAKANRKGKKKGQDEVKAQEAHEAIRPTHMEWTEFEEEDGLAKKIYRLIWQRAIQSVMTPLRGETTTLRYHVEEDEFEWESQKKEVLFEGWRRAGSIIQVDVEEEKEEEKQEESTQAAKEESSMKEWKVGDRLRWTSIHAEPVETKPKPRFTEATLIRELETYGIGRPSTFASLLAVIQEKGYVEAKDIPAKEVNVTEYTMKPNEWPPNAEKKKKKVGGEKAKLVPTPMGRSVLHFMLQHFDDLFSYDFTSKMEKRLDAIAEGKEDWKTVLSDLWNSYKDRYEQLRKGGQQKEDKNQKDQGDEKKENPKRREWGDHLVAVQTKKGPLLLIESDPVQFLGWPEGISFQEMTQEKALAFKQQQEQKNQQQPLGTWEDTPILKKSGKFGTYLQCGEESIPYQEGESLDEIIKRFEAKKQIKQGEKTFDGYTVRTGPYGPYIMKTTLKKPQFVSLPKGIPMERLTQKEVEHLYKTGLETKKSWKKNNKGDK